MAIGIARRIVKTPAIVLLLALATSYFLWTGRHGDWGDFAPVYGSARCVIAHEDPYSTGAVAAQIANHGGPRFSAGYWTQHSLLYPPLTYYVLRPLGQLDYERAGLTWFWLSAVLMAGGFLSVAFLSPAAGRAVACIGVSAILATSGGLLRLGQISGAAMGCTAMGSMLFLQCERRTTRSTATILFVLGACLKPQLVLPVLLVFCLLRGTRRYAIPGMALFGAVFLLSGVMLGRETASADWVPELAAMVRTATPTGMQARVDTGLVDVKSLTSLAVQSQVLCTAIDAALCAAVFAAIWAGFARSPEKRLHCWVVLAGMAFLTLMLTYHRSYDMRLQVLALPALGLIWRNRPRVAAWLTVLSALLLFSTAQPVLRSVTAHFGEAYSHTLLVRLFVERQQAVVVLAAAVSWGVVSLRQLWRRAEDGAA